MDDDRPLAYVGHTDIDGIAVHDGDIVQMAEDPAQHYEVQWDNEAGAWGIYYRDYNAFSVGMLGFMQVVGSTDTRTYDNDNPKFRN